MDNGFYDRPTLGELLHLIRITGGETLREFCRKRKLDPIRYSCIERDKLDPTLDEIRQYVPNLVEPKPTEDMLPAPKD